MNHCPRKEDYDRQWREQNQEKAIIHSIRRHCPIVNVS
jgi:hypothetical protein